MRRFDVRSRRSWTLSAVLMLMTAVMLPGLTMFIFGQAAPASQTGAPPLPPAGVQNGAPAGAPAGGARGARGGGARGGAPAAPAGPTPRFPDGTPRLGALPGQSGLWNGGGGGATDVPYQPWAKAISTYR